MDNLAEELFEQAAHAQGITVEQLRAGMPEVTVFHDARVALLLARAPGQLRGRPQMPADLTAHNPQRIA